MRFRSAWLVLGCVLASTLALAGETGGLRVRIYDAKDSEPLPGATVTLTHNTGNIPPTTYMSDADGFVIFPVLRAGGGYSVEVAFPGFARLKLEVRIKIGETVELPVPMSEAIQETVQVIGTREVVDLEKTETSTKFSDEFIKDLPVQGRFYQNVLTLAPGVSDDDGDGNPNVNGARSRDFKAMVGGISNVDPLTGEFLNYVNPDSIEEIEVVTAGAGVEYGRAQGGFANVVQKQGSNEIEGQVSMFYRSSKFDGTGADDTIPSALRPEFESLQPGFQLSGPIMKDRLWYVLSYEYHKDQVPVNTLSDIVVIDRTQPIASGVVTWQSSPRNKLTFSYRYDPITATNVGVTNTRPEENTVRREVGGPTYSMQWTAPYSPKLLVDSIIGYQDTHSNTLPMTSGINNQCVVGTTIAETSDCFNLVTGFRTGSVFLAHRDQRQRLTVRTQAELYAGKIWGINQQFKLGFIAENERYFQYEERRPFSTFEIIQREGESQLERVGLLTANFSVPAAQSVSATGTTWGIWAEDQMKPINNLTVTVGVRLDREQVASKGVLPFDPEAEANFFMQQTAPPPIGQSLSPTLVVQQAFTGYENVSGFLNEFSQVLGVSNSVVNNSTVGVFRQSQNWLHRRQPGAINIVNDNVSPFLAASWDPWSDSKTKFGFTIGRHYNNIPLNIPVLELQPAGAVVNYEARPNSGEGDVRWRVQPLDEINPGVDLNVVDRNLKTPYNDEFTFSFERELTSEMLFRLTYVKRDFKDQLQDVDINHAPGDFGRCVVQSVEGGPTIEPLPRTASNPFGGDGIMDDCVGRFVGGPRVTDDENPAESRLSRLKRPDGFLDTYVLNPAFGNILLVGNLNTAKYDGITLELERRLYRGWELNGSYTWSEAKGQAEDFNQELGDDRTLVVDEYGFLGFDQTHVVKINATTVTPWGFRLGGTISWQSGYPYSLVDRRLSSDAVPPAYFGFGNPDQPRARRRYLTHQRNDQRNEPYWVFNVRFAKELSFKGGKNLQLSAEIFNLMNDDPLRIFEQVNRTTNAVREFGRRYQFGAKFAF